MLNVNLTQGMREKKMKKIDKVRWLLVDVVLFVADKVLRNRRWR